MNPRRLTALALHAQRARSTARLRLTLWYGGLFLVSGAALLALTYGLVIQAFVGNTAGMPSAGQPTLTATSSARSRH
jgi:hypothetical protein